MNTIKTDFYEVTMGLALLLSGKANKKAGFEAFVRHVKPEINPDKTHYIFKGEQEIIDFVEKFKETIKSGQFIVDFKKLILPKIDIAKRDEYEKKLNKAFESVDNDFEYTVVKDGFILRPLLPAFQYKGPIIYGLILETMILNIINGKTGATTFCSRNDINKNIKNKVAAIAGISSISKNEQLKIILEYQIQVKDMAIKFRESTNKPLFDGCFRRAPSFEAAFDASMTAIKNGWNATSNTSLFGCIDGKYIGGTMAHAFIMCFEKEEDAFIVWNDIFPNSTMLVDTYDTLNAVRTLIRINVKPAVIRIDSGDLKILSFAVRKILDEAGWNDVKIFISGDLTPEILEEFENEGVPFDLAMAGTKYVNVRAAVYTNAGFVYKLVQYEKEDGTIVYPLKKAEGKTNYPGLKTIVYSEINSIVLSVNKETFGYDSKVFDRGLETPLIINIQV